MPTSFRFTRVPAVLAALVGLALPAGQAWGADPTTTFFTEGITAGFSDHVGITTGPDGNLWFTETATNKVGRITPAGVATEFTTGISGNPRGIAAGPDGNVWFAMLNGNKIGRITPSGVVTDFPLVGASRPDGITAGPDGNLWFGVLAGGVGRITPTGTITIFREGIRSNQAIRDVTTGSDGNLWFIGAGANGSTPIVGRITPTGTVTEFSHPFPSFTLSDITLGPDGNVWVAGIGGLDLKVSLGRITPNGTITDFSASVPAGGEPRSITAGADGNLWAADSGFTTFPEGRVFRITPAGTVSPVSVGTGPPGGPGSSPRGITSGPDGNLWFGDQVGPIGRINLPPGISVTKPGLGQGTVTSSPGGINCGSDCAEEYTAGAQVTLTASAAAGSSFAGFTGGGCSGTGTTCTVTVNSANAVAANFTLNDPRTLTIAKTGSGSGAVTSDPGGVDCGIDCSQDYPGGSQITLTAAPAAGSTFAGFSGGGCSGTATTCTVTLSQAATVTARFIRPRGLTVVNAGSGQGTITSAPDGISCGADCTDTYDAGTSITLTANPAPNTRFAGFTGGNGDCGGTASTCVLTLDEAASVTGTFVAQRELTISRTGAGQGTVTSSPAGISCGSDCSRLFDQGSQITLSASPAGGSDFAGFSGGGCSGSSTTCTVTMGQAATVTATFTPTPSPPPPPAPDPVPPTVQPPAPDTVRPTVSAVSVADAAFTIGSLLPRLAQASRVGTTIRFRLSEPATVRLTFARVSTGRRVGSSCRASSRRLRSRPACTRFVTVRPSITMRGAQAGASSVRFQGRLSSTRRLRPGRYRLTVTATDAAGNRSLSRTARFRLLAARGR